MQLFTVYTELLNFNSILDHLYLNYLLVACVKGAYVIARKIQQFNPDKHSYFGSISHGKKDACKYIYIYIYNFTCVY